MILSLSFYLRTMLDSNILNSMRSEDESVFAKDEVVLFLLHLDQILLVHSIHEAALRHIVHSRIIDIL